MDRQGPQGGGGGGTMVDVGLKRDVRIDYTLKPGVRVTLQLPPNQDQPAKGGWVAGSW